MAKRAYGLVHYISLMLVMLLSSRKDKQTPNSQGEVFKN